MPVPAPCLGSGAPPQPSTECIARLCLCCLPCEQSGTMEERRQQNGQRSPAFHQLPSGVMHQRRAARMPAVLEQGQVAVATPAAAAPCKQQLEGGWLGALSRSAWLRCRRTRWRALAATRCTKSRGVSAVPRASGPRKAAAETRRVYVAACVPGGRPGVQLSCALDPVCRAVQCASRASGHVCMGACVWRLA